MSDLAATPVVSAAPSRRLLHALWAVPLIVALVMLPQIGQALGVTWLVSAFTRFAIYALAAAALNLVMGYGGLVSFGHGAFFGIGGYVVGIMAHHLSEGDALLGAASNMALVVWPLAMLVAGLVGVAIGWLSLRTSGVQFIMITLAFGQLVYVLLVSLKYYGGDDGLLVPARSTIPGVVRTGPTEIYYATLVALGLWLLLTWRIVHSRFGAVLRGLRQSERRIQSLGYAARPYRLVAFAISAAGMGLSGALWAEYARFVSPDMAAWTKSGEFMAMVILGGVGTMAGPVIGASVYLALEQVFTSLTERWMLIFGPALVLVVLLGRRGIVGMFEDVWQRFGGGRG
ncbi:branched-chain amino acid ABC transporter permease [Roseomonas sp. CCTCC AB2023176]|uniref:branched-chain amino acid ABC transporter permease n=1 Tax=Roseomonas sp. CCTCC AB2023176 TaxID=3342640 RepID=UPI0035E0C232